MPRRTKAPTTPIFSIDYSSPAIVAAAAEFGQKTLSHLESINDGKRTIKDRVQYLRENGYEVIADELYDAYSGE